MSYRVFVSRRAQRGLASIHGAAYERVKWAMLDLVQDPRPPRSAKLASRDGWRLRVGEYRVVYDIDDDDLTVVILRVGHRRDVYR